MSRARTLASILGSDGALNVADLAGLAAVASSGSAADLSTGTLPIARIADGAVTAAKLASTAVTDKLGYTPLNKAGDTITSDLYLGNGTTSGATIRMPDANMGGKQRFSFYNWDGNVQITRRASDWTYQACDFQIDNLGRVTTPSQVFFSARTITTGTTAISTDAVISFPNVTKTVGSGYDQSTSRFTAPVDGVYLFTVSCTMQGQGTGGTYNAIYFDGPSNLSSIRLRMPGNMGTNIWAGINGAVQVYLLKNDSVQLRGYTDNGTMNIQSGEGTWTGRLVG